MENNRNLSSIIRKIRDDGPPGQESTSAAQAAPADFVSSAARSGTHGGRGVLRGVILLLLCGVVVAGAVYSMLQITGDDVRSGWQSISSRFSGQSADLPAQPVLPSQYAPAVSDTALSAALDQQGQVLKRLQGQLVLLQEQVAGMNNAISEVQAGFDKHAAEQNHEIEVLDNRQQETLQQLQQQLDDLKKQVAAVPVATRVKPAPEPKPAAAKPTAAATAPVPDRIHSGTVENASTPEEWVVNVASSADQAYIDQEESDMLRLGIAVERQTVDFGGEIRYRLRVTGFPTGGEARRYAAKLEKEMGIKGAWASRK